MEEKYFDKDIVACYRTDLHNRLRPEAFLDLAQQLAVKGAQRLPFNDTALMKHDCVWVLARMKAVFEREVKFDSELGLSTWHKGPDGLYFLRDYQLWDDKGIAVNSTSSWIVMNATTRRISRDEKVMELLDIPAQCSEHAIEQPCPKIVFPKNAEAELLGVHKVRYSDIDKNGHTNNVKYTVWALDNLPQDLVLNHRLKELSINFNKEALPGEEVALYHAEIDGAHTVEGRSQDHQVFIEKLIFE